MAIKQPETKRLDKHTHTHTQTVVDRPMTNNPKINNLTIRKKNRGPIRGPATTTLAGPAATTEPDQQP